MAYTINKTDGTTLVTLIDGTVDNTTDLTLIGKNYTGFGEQINENFVKLLENFASRSEPTRPLLGQLWFDTVSARLMVYSLTGWKPAGGPIVQSQSPLTFATGDFWIDNNENQLYFSDGTDVILAGPIWKRSQGKTGWVAETLTDSNNNPKSVLYLYVANALIGIWSAEEFVPAPLLDGFARIYKGYTSSSIISTTINSTVSNSLRLNGLESTNFMRSNAVAFNDTKLVIQNNDGITLGSTQGIDIKVSGTTLIVENLLSGGDITVKTTNNTGTYNPIYIDSGTNRVGIFTSTPQQTMDIAGNLRVRGNLSVEGDSVVLNASTLEVEDKTIVIANSTNPSDAAADGAGIIIKATSDRSILWNAEFDIFLVTSNINIEAGKSYGIGGVPVISQNSLGPGIISAPGITSIGPQVSLTVDDIFINNNRISSTNENQDIELEPLGNGNIALIGSPRIVDLGQPVNNNDASTKIYTEYAAKILPISLSIIDNGLEGAIDTNIVSMLNQIAPPLDFVVGKKAYIHVQNLNVLGPTVGRYVKICTIVEPGNTWEVTGTTTSNV